MSGIEGLHKIDIMGGCAISEIIFNRSHVSVCLCLFECHTTKGFIVVLSDSLHKIS